MGTRRRERQTAHAPVRRETLDRYAVADPKTWPEVVKRAPEYASRWRPSADQPRWQQPENPRFQISESRNTAEFDA